MITVLPLGVIGFWQIVIIVLVVLLLFGGKKIPELMRGLGQGVQEFKHGMDEAKKAFDAEPAEKSDKVLEPDKIEKTK